MITGQCLCGAVRYQITAAPLTMYHCHCLQCRRASGASFATSMLVRTEGFEVTAGEDVLSSFESSPRKRRHFCSNCGSPIFSADEASPQIRSIRSGTLDGDPEVRPGHHIHVGSKSPWFDIHDDLPQKSRGLVDP